MIGSSRPKPIQPEPYRCPNCDCDDCNPPVEMFPADDKSPIARLCRDVVYLTCQAGIDDRRELNAFITACVKESRR